MSGMSRKSSDRLKGNRQEGKPSDFNCTKTFNTGQKYT